jgi:hypothetical protein
MSLPETYTIRAVTLDSYTLTVDYVDKVTGDPIDITGETVTAKFYSDDTLLLTLTDGDGLTVTPATGRVVIALDGTQTDALDGKKNRRYTLRLDTSETTILIGKVEVVNV